MKKAMGEFVIAFKACRSAYQTLVRTIVRKYWPQFMVVMAFFTLSFLVGFILWTQQSHGTVPVPAMDIKGRAGWWIDGDNAYLAVIAERTRYVSCPGALLKRDLVYEGKPDVPAVAESATRKTSLTATPVIGYAEETPAVSIFTLRIPIADKVGLKSIRWLLLAPEGNCEDGEARINQGVGLIEIPPYPEVQAMRH